MHTLRLPLKTNKNTEGLFEKRFQLIARIHNQTVKHAKKLLTQLDKSKEYRTLRKEYGELKVKADAGDELAAIQKELVADKMNAFRDSLGLSKNAFDKYVAKMQLERPHPTDVGWGRSSNLIIAIGTRCYPCGYE